MPSMYESLEYISHNCVLYWQCMTSIKIMYMTSEKTNLFYICVILRDSNFTARIPFLAARLQVKILQLQDLDLIWHSL